MNTNQNTEQKQTHTRIRVCVAIIEDNKLLMVSHKEPDGSLTWYIPGGGLEYCESLVAGAKRECFEEAHVDVEIGELLDISETIHPEQPWHSIALTYIGRITGGTPTPENHPKYGLRELRWFSKEELIGLHYRPASAVEKALSGDYVKVFAGS